MVNVGKYTGPMDPKKDLRWIMFPLFPVYQLSKSTYQIVFYHLSKCWMPGKGKYHFCTSNWIAGFGGRGDGN